MAESALSATSARSPRVFRVDHVGSLLRPASLLEARAAFAGERLSREALGALENDCIREAVQLQEAAGLAVVTDGDYRRGAFHIDFLNALAGITWDEARFAHAFGGGPSEGESPAVFRTHDRIRHLAPITVDDWRYTQDCTSGVAKVTMPSPSFAHYRGGRAAVAESAYPDMEDFFSDLAAAYRKEIAALAAAGCKYVQLDEVHFTFFCDPKMVAALRARGDDPVDLAHRYARLINASTSNRPADMAIGIHLCRGNRRSSWVAEGGYEAIAETLFNAIDADIFLLEYDSARAGGFEPIRFAPKGRRLVLGLVTSKQSELEDEDVLLRRIDEASKFADIADIGIGPQCGFASSTGGNLIDADAQWRKLSLCADVALRAWGTTD